MQLDQRPRPQQTVHVSTKLVTSSTILHLSADELERTIHQEQAENPALEVTEQRICLFCSTPLYGSTCSLCGRSNRATQPLISNDIDCYDDTGSLQWGQQTFYDIDNYGFSDSDNEEMYDPLARISSNDTLAEELLQQLTALIPTADAPIAEQLVGNLNERGYLDINIHEVAELLHVSLARVEYVLNSLQMLEPAGIGARDLRECLLIQLRTLSEQSVPHPLAYALIDRYLDQLGHNHFQEIARRLKVPEQDVRQASTYIRTALHPYPAHIYQSIVADTHFTPPTSDIPYIHPDVIIRRSENGLEIELMEEKRYRFRIEGQYLKRFTQPLAHADNQHYFCQNRDRARFFVDCIQRRWQTLKRVAEMVVTIQHDFLEKGVRYLLPLTRADVARYLRLDESTVSRATANKYALLPNGHLMPIASFFDSSLTIKDQIRTLIQHESTHHRLSDEEIARLLTTQGTRLARRTITKYREEMGIGSSRDRS